VITSPSEAITDNVTKMTNNVMGKPPFTGGLPEA
jgi:hypothetical protein